MCKNSSFFQLNRSIKPILDTRSNVYCSCCSDFTDGYRCCAIVDRIQMTMARVRLLRGVMGTQPGEGKHGDLRQAEAGAATSTSKHSSLAVLYFAGYKYYGKAPQGQKQDGITEGLKTAHHVLHPRCQRAGSILHQALQDISASGFLIMVTRSVVGPLFDAVLLLLCLPCCTCLDNERGGA